MDALVLIWIFLGVLGLASGLSSRRLIRWGGTALILLVALWAGMVWLGEVPNLLLSLIKTAVQQAIAEAGTAPARAGNTLRNLLGMKPGPTMPPKEVNAWALLATPALKVSLSAFGLFLLKLASDFWVEVRYRWWSYLWDPIVSRK